MMRVLIAEDDTIIRLDLRGLLESSRFDVCGEARDGVEAVELAAALEPEAILMAKEGISEEAAFARLRRASQRSGRPMKVIADAVAATLG